MRYLVINSDMELTCFDDLDEAREFAIESADNEEGGIETLLYELTDRKPTLLASWADGREQIRGAW